MKESLLCESNTQMRRKQKKAEEGLAKTVRGRLEGKNLHQQKLTRGACNALREITIRRGEKTNFLGEAPRRSIRAINYKRIKGVSDVGERSLEISKEYLLGVLRTILSQHKGRIEGGNLLENSRKKGENIHLRTE